MASLLEKLKQLLTKLAESLGFPQDPHIDGDLPPITPPFTPPTLPTPPVSRIIDWAMAIEQFEDAPPMWCNPGAIRGTNGKFLQFKNHQVGFDYLIDYLKRVCTGKHKAYKKGGETTLREFQNIYSPPSENPTLIYAKFIAKKLNATLDTKIKDFL